MSAGAGSLLRGVRSLTRGDGSRVDTFADDALTGTGSRLAKSRRIRPSGLDRLVQVGDLYRVGVERDGPDRWAILDLELDCLGASRRRRIVGDVDVSNVDRVQC